MLTTKDVLKEGRISNRTFALYRSLKLLPQPIKREFIKGGGSRVYYNKTILYDLEIIRNLKQQGLKLKAIRNVMERKKDFENEKNKRNTLIHPNPTIAFQKLGEKIEEKYPNKKLISQNIMFLHEKKESEEVTIFIQAKLT